MQKSIAALCATAIGLLSLAAPYVLAASNAPVPNLSGNWQRNVFNLAPPPNGPGPFANTYKSPDGRISDAYRVGDYKSPLLKPQAADLLKRRGELSLSGAAIPDPHNQCWPEPPAFSSAIEMGLDIVQSKDEVVLVTLTGQTVRHVRMNAQHPANVTPTWLGDSVGHYEGDTLVIDTVGIKAGPRATLDRYGTPFSGALHVVERYRLIEGQAAAEALRAQRRAQNQPATLSRVGAYGAEIDLDPKKKGLQVLITVDDPGTFTATWSGVVTYLAGASEWPEVICAENLNEVPGLPAKPPLATQPDF
jgi:hypothetical protein